MQDTKTTIKQWAQDDRPREKLLLKGPDALSNSELIAILIGSGTSKKSAVDVAKELLSRAKDDVSELAKLSLKELMKTSGIGEARAVTIAAALELGRRRKSVETLKNSVKTSADIAHFFMAQLQDKLHEVFAVAYLNRANKINHLEVISEGGITGTVADPRIILKKALEHNAVNIVLCHNHPSGSLKPSRADEMLTRKIKEAAVLLDMNVIDHIIVSEEGYYSFADEGIL
ncbi:JAB domain-containing protein [Lacibacter luteus]|uniref:JAB domain-containing protein n=1 Tax=Lacibacter luteus TaxID=2508719 RepID=A0A4Q1CEI7_9BACT|nr:DNA repair protein RadC [Lacibacter luteus]RXK57846.1 JAB domain-containing protein [Lacibacter luteus]